MRNIGALMIRIDILIHNHNKEPPQNSTGNDLGLCGLSGFPAFVFPHGPGSCCQGSGFMVSGSSSGFKFCRPFGSLAGLPASGSLCCLQCFTGVQNVRACAMFKG